MSLKENKIQGTFKETYVYLVSFTRWIILCLAILYFASGVYSISSNEIGILQRFGKVLNDKVQPGIHYALPWPVDRVIKVPMRTVKRMVIDDYYSTSSNQYGSSKVFSGITGLDSYCITGDNNLANVMCVIQYNITNPIDYIFRIKKQDTMLRSMAGNTIIHCLARMPIDEALTRGKQWVANYVKLELQKRLDEAQSGLGVSFVELKDIKPPDRVQDAFSDVVKADIDREKMINEATAYWNEKIPEAKADANRIIQEGEAYKNEVVLRAEGDADRFNRLLNQVRGKGESIRKMIYVEAMREIMNNVGKKYIVMHDKSGNVPANLRIYGSQ